MAIDSCLICFGRESNKALKKTLSNTDKCTGEKSNLFSRCWTVLLRKTFIFSELEKVNFFALLVEKSSELS